MDNREFDNLVAQTSDWRSVYEGLPPEKKFGLDPDRRPVSIERIVWENEHHPYLKEGPGLDLLQFIQRNDRNGWRFKNGEIIRDNTVVNVLNAWKKHRNDWAAKGMSRQVSRRTKFEAPPEAKTAVQQCSQNNGTWEQVCKALNTMGYDRIAAFYSSCHLVHLDDAVAVAVPIEKDMPFLDRGSSPEYRKAAANAFVVCTGVPRIAVVVSRAELANG